MPIHVVDDLELYYEEYACVAPGGATRPRVVLLHGLGSSARDWEYQLPALRAAFDVVACDLRGHGRSGKPRGRYSIAGLAHDVAALLRSHAAGPTHVVGLSMGAMVAVQLALDHPELVRSIVIVNATTGAGIGRVRRWLLVWQRKLLVRVLGMRTLARVLAGRLFPKPEQASLRARIRASWPDNDVVAYSRAIDAIARWDVHSRVGEIACDALVVSGDRDYTPVVAKAALVSAMSSARLAVIRDSGHATPLDQPEAFNTVLLGFLGGDATAIGHRFDDAG